MTKEEIKTLYEKCMEAYASDAHTAADSTAVKELCKALKTVNAPMYEIFRTYCAENTEDILTALVTFWATNNPEKTLLNTEVTLAVSDEYIIKCPSITYKTVKVPDKYTVAVYNSLTLFSGVQVPVELLQTVEIKSAYKQYWNAVSNSLTSSEAWASFVDAVIPVIANATMPKSNIGVFCNYKVQDKQVTGVLTARVHNGKIKFIRTCASNVSRFLPNCESIVNANKPFTDTTGRTITATYRALKDYTEPILESTVIQTEVEHGNIFTTNVPDKQTVYYMPKFQACRCAGIPLEVVDVKSNGYEYTPILSITKNKDKAMQSIYKYYVYMLHNNGDNDVIEMFAGETDAIQRVIDKLSRTLLLCYAVTAAESSDIGVAAYIHSRAKAPLFGEYLRRTSTNNDTNAQRYYRTSADRVLCSPDMWQTGKLLFTLHSDKVLYFTQTDFGYKANHRRYEHAPLKLSAAGNGGPLLGRTISGEDFCPGDWLSNAYLGLAIFAGSRSGKGVLTNNIISTLLASGSGVIYIDSKPEQARAIWGFERYYNTKTQGTRLKLLAVDWNAPIAEYGNNDFGALIAQRKHEELAALDKTSPTYSEEVNAIESRYASQGNDNNEIPMHGCTYATANIPTFFSEQWFIDYCKNVGAGKVCTPEFFNAIRVLKLLHLIVSDGLIRAGIPNNPEVGPLYGGRVDLNRYGYVIWDELQKTTGTFGPILAQLYPLVKALTADTAKKRKNGNSDDNLPTLAQLETAQRYVTRIHMLYNIFNATGTGTETGAVRSELISGFSDFNTFAKTSNIKFIFISQNAPQKINIPYPVGLYTLFKSCGLLVGRNGYIGSTNEFAYDTTIECAPLVNGNVAAVCPSAGDVSVSGYFTYRSNGDPASARVFKSYLTLLENDIAPMMCPENVKEVANYTQDTRGQYIDINGGCCGLGDGSGVVINTIGRIPQDARESVIKNDCYKEDGTRNEELGFIGSTYALMQMATVNNHIEMDALANNINKFYEELLYVVNANNKMAGNATEYTSIEAYIGDMAYESLLSYATYRLNPPKDKLEDTAEQSMNTDQFAVHTAGEEFVFNMPDTDEGNDENTTESHVKNEDETQVEEQKPIETTTTQNADSMQRRQATKKPTATAKESYTTTSQETTVNAVYGDVDEYTKAAFQQAAKHGVTDKLASRKQLTEFLRRCIKSFVNDDYSLITTVRIDDVGHLYINETLIQPRTQELGQNIPAAMKVRLDKGCWGDLYCANSLFAYRNMQSLDVAANRVTTVAYELGVNEIGDVLKPRYQRANFPYLTQLYISGSPYTAQTARVATLADKLSAIIDRDTTQGTGRISNAATTLWQNCRPLRFATKVFGYSAGLKVAWAGAALFGPIGLAIAGLGTAALAFTEYDSFKQSRATNTSAVSGRTTRAQAYVDTTYKTVDEDIQTTTKQKTQTQSQQKHSRKPHN